MGFEVLPTRWIVERTFAWLGNYRRLSKDYEGRTKVSEAFVYVAIDSADAWPPFPRGCFLIQR